MMINNNAMIDSDNRCIDAIDAIDVDTSMVCHVELTRQQIMFVHDALFDALTNATTNARRNMLASILSLVDSANA